MYRISSFVQYADGSAAFIEETEEQFKIRRDNLILGLVYPQYPPTTPEFVPQIPKKVGDRFVFPDTDWQELFDAVEAAKNPPEEYPHQQASCGCEDDIWSGGIVWTDTGTGWYINLPFSGIGPDDIRVFLMENGKIRAVGDSGREEIFSRADYDIVIPRDSDVGTLDVTYNHGLIRIHIERYESRQIY